LLAFNTPSLEKQIPHLREKAIIIASTKSTSNLNFNNFVVLKIDVADKYENIYLL
jgi:hypothetical protein